MAHINELRINNFRGLRDLKIEGLGQVNLFVGNNNSGKTSVLEALALFCDPLNLMKWYDVGSRREVIAGVRSLGLDRITWLFAQGADLKEKGRLAISVSGNTPIKEVSASYEKFNEIVTITPINPRGTLDASGGSIIEGFEEHEEEVEGIKILITISGEATQSTLLENGLVNETLIFADGPPWFQSKQKQVPTLPAIMINPFTHRTGSLTSSLWSEVVEADLKDETIQLLQHFDPAIRDVDFIAPTESRQLISVKHATLGRAPLHTFGDGLRRVFTLAAAIPRVRGGFLLIDELETSIHARALERTFAWLIKACVDNNVQLLATTHSLEALDVTTGVSSELTDFVVYQLQQEKNQTIAKKFDEEMVLLLRDEMGMDLR